MKRTCSVWFWFLAVLVVPIAGLAQEATDEKKAEATALVKEAFDHVYEGEHALALEKFQRAHEIYPSPKILLNIGTTFKKLGRYAESAEVYERYLRHPETDKSREAEVRAELTDVEAHVGHLRIEVDVQGARILVDGKVMSIDSRSTVRVNPGSHTVVAEKEGYESRTASAFDVKAKEVRAVQLSLVSHEEQARQKELAEAKAFESGQAAALSAIRSRKIDTARRLGAAVGIAVAVQEPATSAFVAAVYGVISRLDIELAAVVGGELALYAGGRGYLTTDRVRLSVSAGVPVFFIDGASAGVRGGVGAGVLVSDHFGFAVDLGVEHYFSLPDTLEATLFVPRVTLEARL